MYSPAQAALTMFAALWAFGVRDPGAVSTRFQRGRLSHGRRRV